MIDLPLWVVDFFIDFFFASDPDYGERARSRMGRNNADGDESMVDYFMNPDFNHGRSVHA